MKEEEKRSVLTQHFRNLNLQKKVEIKSQNRFLASKKTAGVAVEVENIWLKSSTLALSKSVLCLFLIWLEEMAKECYLLFEEMLFVIWLEEMAKG